MAFIRRGENEPIPEDAVEVTADKVFSFYNVLIRTWEPKTEIWGLTIGPAILGAAAGATGLFVNRYFRRQLRLRNYGFFTTYLPNVVLPTVITTNFHDLNVQRKIILDPYGCSLCFETRAVVVQFFCGVVQPSLLAPMSVFMFATRHFTARIPSPIHYRKEFFKFCLKLSRPLKVPMSINIGVQALLAIFITHMEENHFIYLQQAIVKPALENEETNASTI